MFLNLTYIIHVHQDATAANCYLQVTPVGSDPGTQARFTCTQPTGGTSFIDIGDGADNHTKTFLIPSVYVN
jgi:hypothetical protein